ncbi:site-2 protease family protein, partial [Candidatus Gottesmanbacteria bacterium]|nr:site-2 protease family protein [Candidatus Gottesmanbacteria bacterium]
VGFFYQFDSHVDSTFHDPPSQQHSYLVYLFEHRIFRQSPFCNQPDFHVWAVVHDPPSQQHSYLVYLFECQIDRQSLVYNLKILGRRESLSENVSGPVGIAGAVGTILSLGQDQMVAQLLNLLGLLSLSLAFMNILPIPALDGGRLVFLLVEAVFGKKLAAKKENLINQFGMSLLLGLIILVSFNDLKKVFGR